MYSCISRDIIVFPPGDVNVLKSWHMHSAVYKVDQSVGDDLSIGKLWYAVISELSVKSELKALHVGIDVAFGSKERIYDQAVSQARYKSIEDKSIESE